MFHYILKSIREFTELQGKLKVAFLVFGVMIATAILSAEPFFMSRVIAYVEDFYKTDVFDLTGFMQFLIIWVVFIIISITTSYIHRYYIADVSALTFHNQVANKYVSNVYYMAM